MDHLVTTEKETVPAIECARERICSRWWLTSMRSIVGDSEFWIGFWYSWTREIAVASDLEEREWDLWITCKRESMDWRYAMTPGFERIRAYWNGSCNSSNSLTISEIEDGEVIDSSLSEDRAGIFIWRSNCFRERKQSGTTFKHNTAFLGNCNSIRVLWPSRRERL